MKESNEESTMAEDILNGVFCEICGEFIGDECGYPRRCDDCKEDEDGL